MLPETVRRSNLSIRDVSFKTAVQLSLYSSSPNPPDGSSPSHLQHAHDGALQELEDKKRRKVATLQAVLVVVCHLSSFR